MAWLSHFGGLGGIRWRVILIGWNYVELGGIGIAPSVYRTVVRVLEGTSPPYNPILLDNNRGCGNKIRIIPN